MSDLKSLDHLGPIADEMLGGLHADEAMRLKIKRAAAGEPAARRKTNMRLVPALCCAALAIACVGAFAPRLNRPDDVAVTLVRSLPQEDTATAESHDTIEIETIAAGEQPAAGDVMLVADLGDGARVRMGGAQEESLFAAGSGDMPLVALDGRVYRMLETPKDIGASMLSQQIGSVKTHAAEPSLASAGEMESGLSNAAQEGAAIYALSGLEQDTAVAAEVDGRMRVFQRVSYAGKGPGGAALEDTFCVRGGVKEVTLSGVGTLEGGAANDVIAVLLDHAVLKSADMSARGQWLTVTLTNGLRLQLGVSGDTLTGCGGWSCPEFFEAFEAAL